MLSQKVVKCALAVTVSSNQSVQDSWKTDLANATEQWSRGFHQLLSDIERRYPEAANHGDAESPLGRLKSDFEAIHAVCETIGQSDGPVDMALVAPMMKRERSLTHRIGSILTDRVSRSKRRDQLLLRYTFAIFFFSLALPAAIMFGMSESAARAIHRLKRHVKWQERRVAEIQQLWQTRVFLLERDIEARVVSRQYQAAPQQQTASQPHVEATLEDIFREDVFEEDIVEEDSPHGLHQPSDVSKPYYPHSPAKQRTILRYPRKS